VSDVDSVSDDRIERVLRWALVEFGTAGLSDDLEPAVLAPQAPSLMSPSDVVIAGPVLVMRRSRDGAASGASSFDELTEHLRPGAVVLVQTDPGTGASFGSNVVLHASCLRAQAVITDGAARDRTRTVQVGLPVGSNGTDPRRPRGCAMRRVRSADLFGTTWNDADWFLRDADGVIRLEPDLARSTAARLAEDATGELAALLAGV
jgi:regulator of RNase E activity RraA